MGTVDIYFHATNADPYFNCITPHRGVAWVRRTDLNDAFKGLKRLGRKSRLIFQDALFPEAFQRQLEIMGLTLEEERVIMVYRPVYGPCLEGETPRGRLPDQTSMPVSTVIAKTPAELAVWLRIFNAGYYNTETLTVNRGAVDALVADAESGKYVFILGYFETTPLGATRMCVRAPTAELEAVVTAPLWQGMGLETQMVMASVCEALGHGCDTVFVIAPTREFTRLYLRLGFLELTHVLTYWLQAEPVNQDPALPVIR
jgi:GNAT superfamily N-acetyltransferase